MIDNKLYDKALMAWRNKYGVGTIICTNKIDKQVLLNDLFYKLYANKKPVVCLFVKDKMQQCLFKNVFKEYCESYSLIIKVFNNNELSFAEGNCIILYDIDNILKYPQLAFVLDKFKFKLCITNKITSNAIRNYIDKKLPIAYTFSYNEIFDNYINNISITEYQQGIALPIDTKEYAFLKKADNYLILNNRIFGDLKNIDKARSGDIVNNISAIEYCTNIAMENGWNPNLDMSIEINKELDKLYNPASLHERAKICYDVIRDRNKILSDNNNKLQNIWNIIVQNKNKKILIISKRNEFADVITQYLNDTANSIICRNFHNDMKKIQAIDIYGNPIVYKSGAKKGQIKYFGEQSQKKLIQEEFVNNKINILSCNNAIDKNLYGFVDIVIITSPLCDDIKTFLYRLSEINFNSKLIVYTLYCIDTSEEKILYKKQPLKNHTIIKDVNNTNISIENDDICIVD